MIGNYLTRSVTAALIGWRARAEAAEAENKQLRQSLDEACDQLTGIEIRMADRAVLVSITRDGRLNKFTFVRNGKVTVIETYATMEDNQGMWHRELMEPITDEQ